jgi:hypothetical protein
LVLTVVTAGNTDTVLLLVLAPVRALPSTAFTGAIPENSLAVAALVPLNPG